MKRYLEKGLKMKARPFSALLLSSAVCVVCANPGLVTLSGAEVPVTTGNGQPRHAATERAREVNPPADSVLEIEGGVIGPAGTRHGGKDATLRNVVDALRERYTEANIAVAPGLENVKVSDLKLRTRNIWEDLEAVRVASGAAFEWQGPGSPVFSERGDISPSYYLRNVATQVNPSTGLPEKPVGPDSTGLFVLRPASVTPEKERNLEAFNIGPYIEWNFAREQASQNPPGSKADPRESANRDRDRATARSIEQVQQIISESLAAMNQGRSASKEPPQFQFHGGANMLILVGTRSQLEIARKVIDALPGPNGFSRENSTVSEPGFPGAPGDMPDAVRRRYGLPSAPATSGETTPGKLPQPPGQRP